MHQVLLFKRLPEFFVELQSSNKEAVTTVRLCVRLSELTLYI